MMTLKFIMGEALLWIQNSRFFVFWGFFLSILFKDNTLAKETTSHFLAANILERNS